MLVDSVGYIVRLYLVPVLGTGRVNSRSCCSTAQCFHVHVALTVSLR